MQELASGQHVGGLHEDGLSHTADGGDVVLAGNSVLESNITAVTLSIASADEDNAALDQNTSEQPPALADAADANSK